MASLQSYLLRFLIRRTMNWNKSLAEIRKDMAGLGKTVVLPKNVKVTPVVDSGIRGELMEPAGAPAEKIMLYLHGGGYCLGVYPTNRRFVAKVAAESGMKVLLLDYRLAPENPFPAAVEDAIAAYRWLLKKAYLPENIVLMGDSSGCGLALAVLITLRNEKRNLPKAMVFLTPMVDLQGTGESLRTRAKMDPFQYLDPLGIAKQYVGDHDPALPLLSPLNADLHDLPPMLVHAADCDVFLSDAVRLVEQAQQAGVEVKLKVWDKMWHIFHMSAEVLPEAKTALSEVYAYISEKMA